jgi:choice-of-anchor B domain-containing protein
MRQLFSFLCLAFVLSATSGQNFKNLQIVGYLPYTPDLNDVWGYAAPDGTEYALVGTRTGASIVSLADPENPEELFFIPGESSTWRDLKTFRHYAYVSNETGGGILVIDLSNLPDAIQTKEIVIGGTTTMHNLYMDNGYLYCSGPNTLNGGIMILDLNQDPWNPTFAGAYPVRYVHDVYVRDSIAYAAEIYDGRLTLIDVRNTFNPQIISSVPYEGGFTHNTWLSDDGKTCFSTDELRGGKIRAWDVSDLNNPVQIDYVRASLSDPEEVIPHNVHVYDDYLVTSYYRDGVQIVDASRPHNLIEVGHYDTSPFEGEGFNGCWGAYPFLPSGLVLASDIEMGLFVLQPNYHRAAYLEGFVKDAETGEPIPEAKIDFLEKPLSELEYSGENGAYATGQADAGVYRVTVYKYGYLPDTVTVTLQEGVVNQRDLLLTSVPRSDFTLLVRSSATGRPVKQAQVKIQGPEPEAYYEGETDSTGKIFFARIPQNPYEALAGKWGFHTRQAEILVAGEAQTLMLALDEGHKDEFVLDLGWKTEGRARRGFFVREAPVKTSYKSWTFNPGSDAEDDLGVECYITGNAGGLPFGDDVDEGFVQLVSPPIALGDYEKPMLTYRYWFLNYTLENGGGQANDFFRISATNGTDTVELARYLGTFDTLWAAQPPIDLKAAISGDSVRILFYTQDYTPLYNDAVEAGIDVFEVFEGDPVSQSATDLVVHQLPGGTGWVTYQFAETAQPPFSLQILDIAGRQIGALDLPATSGAQALPQNLSGGMYLLRLADRQQAGVPHKWVKR